MITSRVLTAAAVVAIALSGCGVGEPSEPPTEPAMPAGLDRAPDAVGMLSETWLAGSGGPVEVTPDYATWGLASDDDSWNGAELGIKRGPVPGVSNGDATVFYDGDANKVPDPSADLWEGQHVRVWCDFVAQSLPPICSVSHLQLSHALEG